MKSKLSVNEFNNLLSDQVKIICKTENKNFDTEHHRGEAFSSWCVQLLQNLNNLDDDSEDILMGGSKDLKIDFVLQSEADQRIYLVQTKFVGMGKRAKKRGDIDTDDLKVFCERHEKLKDPQWIKDNGNERVVGRLLDYKDLIEEGYVFNFIYITTANTTDTAEKIVNDQQKKYEELKEEVNLELIDFNKLKEYYVNASSSEQSIPQMVEMDLPKDKYIIKDKPYETLLAIVKASSIINIYKQYKKGIFTWNIRGHLGGDKGINKNIKSTAEDNPEDFYYFNNGISAVCTDFDVDEKGKLTAKKFQIINGAQTVGSLFLARDKAPQIDLLLKLTRSGSVSTEKGFNADIIKFNNTQNKVNLSDFRSNDKVQEAITKNFANAKSMSVNGIKYLRKRGERKETGKTNITLENLARIRYAFLHNPCDVISNAKSLWDTEKNGKYHIAFGINNQIEEVISEKTFEDTFVIPVCLFSEIEKNCKERSKDEAFRDIKRFKYHFLSLSKILLEFLNTKFKESVSSSKLIKDKNYLERYVQKFLKIAIPNITDLINSAYADIKEGKHTSINAPLRDLQISRSKWDNIVKNFDVRLKVMENKEIKNFMSN